MASFSSVCLGATFPHVRRGADFIVDNLCDLSEEGAHQMFRWTPMALLSAPRAVAQPSMCLSVSPRVRMQGNSLFHLV
jgi:hypothetical protein